MDRMKIKANAKINLALAVKYKREDNYHEIESIFQEIDFSDEIRLTKSEDVVFATNASNLGNDEDNLCVRAARLLQKEYEIPGLDIFLQKEIPAGSGLGGGSSDAAAVIKAGLALYKVNIPLPELIRSAARLGADIPFFLAGGTSYVSGIGEVLAPVCMNIPYNILLILPELHISTVWAYKNLNLTLTKKKGDYKFRGFRCQDLKLDDFASEFHNDFEPAVFRHHPELEQIKSDLYDQGAQYAALSGSGSGIFGLFASELEAKRAKDFFCSTRRCLLTKPVYRESI
ncbi:MAG: 4-(cytidine 5'-diphospho)-2-C-methyl-D-erythritol kinase [Calditrichales bacterium]|nr:MAG: 4-(cytidine 5'-diphospho)-2-C-methyl-D-erythritol kinase [Calditrichales bacterium]